MEKDLATILNKQALKTGLDQSRFNMLKGIARGEAAVREDRLLSNSAAKEKMRRWLK